MSGAYVKHSRPDRDRPRRRRTDRVCVAKRRYVTEVEARALGQVSLEQHREPGDPTRIWPYRCLHCAGWHLTHHRNSGVLPITLADALEGAPKKRAA